MAPGRGTRQSCSLSGEGGIQALPLGIKAFQDGHAPGHAFDPVGFVEGVD